MIDMKCPFCNEPLVITNKNLVSCQNLHCEIGNLPMPLIVVKETMRTKKQLEMAINVIDTCRQYERGTACIAPDNLAVYCDIAIKHIKELKQKDVK